MPLPVYMRVGPDSAWGEDLEHPLYQPRLNPYPLVPDLDVAVLGQVRPPATMVLHPAGSSRRGVPGNCTERETLPPESENFTAFPSRLTITW